MSRRRVIEGAVALGLASTALGFGAAHAAEPRYHGVSPSARTARPRGPAAVNTTVVFRTSPQLSLAALTLDDGPTRRWTPLLLDVLARHDARATFFRVGRRAAAASDLVRRTADAGHEQGNHTWDHADLTSLDQMQIQKELASTHELLTRLTGRAPTLMRPPYGRIDSVGLAVAAEMRYRVTLWSEHVTGAAAAPDVDAVLRDASPGSIILAHDGGSEPSETLIGELDRLLASMTDRGYRFVTISELVAASTR